MEEPATPTDVLLLKLQALKRLQSFEATSPVQAVDQAADDLSRLQNSGKRLPTTEAALSDMSAEEFPLFASRPPDLASLPAVPTPDLGHVEPPAQGVVPDLASYDYVIVTMSGGKDSLACLVAVLEEGQRQGVNLRAQGRVEVWHHDVDGRGGTMFMDWPCTEAYCRAVAVGFHVPIYFSWRQGGFEAELLKKDAKSQPVVWEEPQPDGTVIVRGTGKESKAKVGTRMKFPQVGANLMTRWCSASLKIDVGRAALVNQERFKGRRTLVISGERAEESAARAKYNTLEPDATNVKSRHVDRWRPVHHWSTAQVWDAIRRWGVVPHPAYRAGFGRVSCAFCIFAGPEEWATLQQLLPSGYERIAQLEASFGATISRSGLSAKRAQELREAGVDLDALGIVPGASLTVRQQAAVGEGFALIGADVEEGRRLAVIHGYDAPILVNPASWILPLGAFNIGAGPS